MTTTSYATDAYADAGRTDKPEHTGGQRVLIVPARSSGSDGRRIFFLFTFRQVEAILQMTPVFPVPFAAPYLKGIARWHRHVIPVLTPEECLGLPPFASEPPVRLMVIRTGDENRRGMLSVAPAIRIISLSLACSPVTDAPWLPRKDLVKGIYEGPEGLLVVLHMENILKGECEIRTHEPDTAESVY